MDELRRDFRDLTRKLRPDWEPPPS